MCGCKAALHSGGVPCRSLRNHLALDKLPEEFKDLTLAEEVLCCNSREKVYVMKPKSMGSAEMARRGYKGNCIAFPQAITDV